MSRNANKKPTETNNVLQTNCNKNIQLSTFRE